MKKVIEEFLLEKYSEGKARATLDVYEFFLIAFADYVGSKPLTDICNADIVGWFAYLRTAYADTSVLLCHKILRAFFNWCVVSELLVKSPLKLKAPKVKRHSPRIASYGNIQKLLRLPADDWMALRNRAFIHLLFDTGMRMGEAISLAVADVDLEQQLCRIPPGKDGEARTVPFTQTCANNLAAYLKARPTSDFDTWLWIGGSRWLKVRGRLTHLGAIYLMKGSCKLAGIPYFNLHSIRHLFAMRALNAGMRVEIVSKIMGHSRVDFTLKVYASLLTETIQREYKAVWRD